MDTRFHVPANWSAVMAAPLALAAAEGDVGAEGDWEHPTERDPTRAKADK